MAPPLAPSPNFRNPLGLLRRMLLSGDRAAYAALWHEALRIAARPLDWLMQGRERRVIAAAPPGHMPIVLVVGAPRSGTTLVYQTLARYLDVSCFTNLTSIFPRSPITSSRLFRWLPKNGAAEFRNFYGQTPGLNGANDGFSVWNQWLGDDRYVPSAELSESQQHSMRQFFDAWSVAFGKPFLNKNNRNTACLELLSRTLPTASFIVVRRDPLLVAQSLIKARLQVQGDKSAGWGLHSQSSDAAADPLSYVDDVCDQILQIERQLDEQLERVAPNRIVEIQYESFCEDPAAAVGWISQQIPGVSARTDLIASELKPFEVSASLSLTHAERHRVLARLKSQRTAVLV
jgi:hypothetical protein